MEAKNHCFLTLAEILISGSEVRKKSENVKKATIFPVCENILICEREHFLYIRFRSAVWAKKICYRTGIE